MEISCMGNRHRHYRKEGRRKVVCRNSGRAFERFAPGALGELAGSIVHEVNQPLTALITSAEACRCWLSRCPMEISEVVEAANQVVNKGKRDVAIAGGLEVLAKGAQANLSFIMIDGVILEVLGMFRDELEKSSISVHADIDEGLPELRGDRLQLQQVVFSLLRNGIDAMKDVHGRARRLEYRAVPTTSKC